MNKSDVVERRLLDMLAGWAEFISTSLRENRGAYSQGEIELLEADEDYISNLYQEAGNLLTNEEQFNGAELPSERVEAFLKDRVIPFILSGKCITYLYKGIDNG